MPATEKPVGATIGWTILETTWPFITPWMRLRQDRIHIEGQGDTTYTYHDHSGSVVIVPLTGSGDIVLIRQYRYPVDAWCLEVPAGGVAPGGVAPRDEAHSSILEVARMELREELGATAADMRHVASYFPANAVSNEVCHIYLALGVEFTQRQRLESTEYIHICPTPAHEALHLARTGQIQDGFSALAILMCEELLREQGVLETQA